MTQARTGTPRERYRSQVRAEIKEHAREQIATAGASALSLSAIAKRMGMSGPALYRYFAGRDELITDSSGTPTAASPTPSGTPPPPAPT